MIGVRKISHASYEMPDLDKQVEYYTDILGLTLIAKEKDAAYLANTVDHHSVVLRNGTQPRCARDRIPDRARRRSRRVREAGAAHGIKTAAQEGSGADDLGHGDFRGSEGHRHGGVQARRIRRSSGSRPRASCRTSSATSPSTSRTSRR